MRFGEVFGGLLPGVRGAVLAVLLRTGSPMTGRRVHAAVRDDHSLWSVQQVLASLVDLGVVEVRTVGRANLYTINEEHYATQPLRILLDPLAALRETVKDAVDSSVQAVILFGSVARGESTAVSDVDLAVIAPSNWAGRTGLEDAVHARLGNDCDVLVLTPKELGQFARGGEEPVVGEIIADGVVLLGSVPQLNRRTA